MAGYLGVSVKAELVSPNDWLIKAGAFITPEGKIRMPMKFLLIPMNNASKSIVAYNSGLPLDERMRLVQTIGLNIRNADKAYFGNWSRTLVEVNKVNRVCLSLFNNCMNCLAKSTSASALREHVSPELKRLGHENNDKIIHAMDSRNIIDSNDFHVVFEYYDCFLGLNLMFFPAIKDLQKQQCKECAKLT